MHPTCDQPIRVRGSSDWQRCGRPKDHGPDGNGLDGHGLVNLEGVVYADAYEAPLYLGDGSRNPHRREVLDTHGDMSHPLTGDGTFREYRKRTTIWAIRMDRPFAVDTLEGMHQGQEGDYLAVGAAGELYPIAADIMEATYEALPGGAGAVDRRQAAQREQDR